MVVQDSSLLLRAFQRGGRGVRGGGRKGRLKEDPVQAGSARHENKRGLAAFFGHFSRATHLKMPPPDVLPRDARLIALLISSCPSITDAHPAVLHQLLEFAHRASVYLWYTRITATEHRLQDTLPRCSVMLWYIQNMLDEVAARSVRRTSNWLSSLALDGSLAERFPRRYCSL